MHDKATKKEEQEEEELGNSFKLWFIVFVAQRRLSLQQRAERFLAA